MVVPIVKQPCASLRKTANALGVDVQLEKVEEMQDIMAYGVMSTPGVVIDEKVVHAGGVPSKESIAAWLSDSTSAQQGSDKPQGGGCCD